jgi:hypothetical protein
MLDFTVKQYEHLLTALQERKYTFQTFSEYLMQPDGRVIMLRHDVDARKQNSLLFAKLLHARGIKGSFYFRMVPQSIDAEVIKEIAGMGHEIGYHYEDMDFARKQFPAGTVKSGLYDQAWVLFKKHLSQLREISPVTTISMHGSPRSKYDNKALWQKYDFRELGIIGEPYLDIDFNEVAYLTDTGRRWNGFDVSIRDKVKGRFNFNFRSTQQIIDHIDQLPDKIMFTFHPQRWTDNPILWLREYIMQNVKNVVKGALVKGRWGSEGFGD